VKSQTSLFLSCALIGLLAAISVKCNKNSTTQAHGMTLRDYARKARERGSREALVPYAFDEEEGDMLEIGSVDDAIASYEWIVGEPIEEQTLTFATWPRSAEPDSIYTVYRIRVEKRLGKSKYGRPPGPLEEKALREMPLRASEVLVIKSGGNIVVDGVLLKKRRSLCFSELMPRRYLFGLSMDPSGRIGWLAMGCRSIFAVDGDRLAPRETSPEIFTTGVKERFGNSLAAFSKAVQSLPTQ
jgi:hypothetical protein